MDNPKTKLHVEKSGIYDIHCDNCDGKYIGHTKRKLKIRLKEHVHLKYNNEEKSAFVKPSLQSNHTLSNIKLIQEVQNSNYVDAFESLTLQTTEKYAVNNEPEFSTTRHFYMYNIFLNYIYLTCF